MRRTIISTMCMTMALVFTASCNKIEENIISVEGIEENIVSVEGNGRTVINGVAKAICGGTKAYNKYSYEVLWNEGDQIWVTDGTKDDTFTLTDGEDTPTGVFTEDNVKGISGNVEAFYPASLKTADGYVWKATQSNNQVAPMYAKQSITGTANEVVNFSSLGAMLQIVFSTKTEDITVTSITLQSNKKPLSGKFMVDENGQAIMTENSKNPGVTLNLGENGVPVGVAATYFYIAIPAGTYSTPEQDEVMTITFTDKVHHKECVMTSTTFPEVELNTVGRITLAGDFQDQMSTVKFDMKGHGEAIQDAKVAWGKKATAPSTPKAANYAFWCWCTDAECTTPYDFSKGVTADMTLYAKWTDGINGHAYVELAGKKWATENVGACNNLIATVRPGKPGNGWGFYFYNQSNASGAAQSWGSEKDASQAIHSWTLPNDDQWNALIEECYWEWTGSYNYPTSPYNGMSGYIVYQAKSDDDKNQVNKEGSGYTPVTVNHLFLPAAGIYHDGLVSVSNQGDLGYYWSAVNGTYLTFRNSGRRMNNNPSLGMAVRPVSE